DGIPPAADANALLQVDEVDGERKAGAAQVAADLVVAYLEAGHRAREALDRPRGAGGGLAEVVDVGEVARARQRQSQGVRRDLGPAQLGVGEAGGRALHRLVVILGHGPRHGRRLLCYTTVWEGR